jgi:peptidyl-dipeptidase Dcp
MSQYRMQEKFAGDIPPIVSNNCNNLKSQPGQPILLSWDDAETMFHEFGHALHGLCSDVHYPSLAGTSVARDFVELPSQIHEHWLGTPEILNRFALHVQTGEPMPAELVERIRKASTFNQGFSTVEFLASAIVDMRIHLEGDRDIDTREYEPRILAEIGMPPQIVMRHRLPQFGHLFHSDSYSAGYYSYLWAEVLDQDAWRAFKEAGGPLDKQVAERFRKHVLSVGNTLDPAQAYRNFRGRDPEIAPLLEARGFPTQG